MLGKEAALFVPSGTQSNLCALMSHCGRGDEYIVGQMAHTYRWEGGGAAVLGSVQPQPLEHQPDGTLALDDIEAAIKPDDAHFARTRLLCLENTIGGKVLPLDYLDAARPRWRARRGLATHLDGARLSTRRSALGGDRVAPARARIAAHFDSVSVCFSQGPGRAGRLGAGRLARLHPQRASLAQDARRRHAPGRRARRRGAARARPPCRAPGRRPRAARAAGRGPAGPARRDGGDAADATSSSSTCDRRARRRPGRAPAQSRGVLATGLYRLRFVTHLDVDATGRPRSRGGARAPAPSPRRSRCRRTPSPSRATDRTSRLPERRPHADHQHRSADAHHRPPRDLPRRDAGAGAPHHERRDVAGDDGGGAGRPAREEGDDRRDHRRGAGDARVRDQGRGRRPHATWSTSSAPAATARTPSTSRPAAMFVAAAAGARVSKHGNRSVSQQVGQRRRARGARRAAAR